MKYVHALSIIFLMTIGMRLQIIAQATDTIWLKKGQILIGELKGITLGKIDFDDDDIDNVEIKETKIKTISASKHVYMLETIHREIYYTPLQPGIDGQVKINVENNWRSLAIEEIGYLTLLGGKTGGLWSGDLSAGYSYTRSSKIGRLNTDMTLSYTTRKVEILSKGSLITTKTDSSYEIENAGASIYSSYLFNARWRGILLLNYQRNLELGLASRFQEGFAMGYTAISSLHSQGKILAGLVLSEEKNTEGVSTPLQVEAPLIFIFDFYHFRKPDMTLNMTQSLYTGITQAGRFRQDGVIKLSWKIISDFSINIQVYDNYDNQPSKENAAKVDYGIVFGLSYEF